MMDAQGDQFRRVRRERTHFGALRRTCQDAARGCRRKKSMRWRATISGGSGKMACPALGRDTSVPQPGPPATVDTAVRCWPPDGIAVTVAATSGRYVAVARTTTAPRAWPTRCARLGAICE